MLIFGAMELEFITLMTVSFLVWASVIHFTVPVTWVLKSLECCMWLLTYTCCS
jgi:hypothetical protein